MKQKKSLMNNKGVFSYAIVFVYAAIVLMFFFALIIPMLLYMNTKVYQVAEPILLDGNATAAKITDANVRATMQGVFETTVEATTTNQDILGFFYQYAWVIIILVILFILFISARVQVETSGGRIA